MFKRKKVENKKIINAKKHTYNDIEFDSGLEVNCYKLLTEANLNFDYSKVRYDIFEGFKPENLHIWMVNPKRQLYKNEKKILDNTTLPDFEVYTGNENHRIIIETKGFANEQYALRRKMLFKVLEQKGKDDNIIYYYFEPANIKHINESIEIIKNIIKEVNNDITRSN